MSEAGLASLPMEIGMDQMGVVGMVLGWLPMLLVQSIVSFIVIYTAVRLAIRHERARDLR